MKYLNFYNRIQNPLDDEKVLEELISAYSEGHGFYSELTKRNSKNKPRRYNPSACDDLHAFLFNTWKKEMLSITREQYEQAIKDKLYDNDIFKFVRYLSTVPDVKTKKEATQILEQQFKDKELGDAMEKYRWDAIDLYGSWTHIHSRYVHAKKVKSNPIEHRLYLNMAPTDVHTMSKIFLEKCIAKRIPYYFKISEYGLRDDNIVIYSDTKMLPKFLSVLKEIEQEYPQLIERAGKPPILTGKIRNWIGYGSEPLNETGKSSFNSVRADSIEQAIKKELISWYKDNIKGSVVVNGKQISIVDYICRNVVLDQLNSMAKTVERCPNSKHIKYNKNDITNPVFTQRLERAIKGQANKVIGEFLREENTSGCIEVKVNDGCTISVYGSSIVKELKSFISTINANDPNFKNRIKARIKIAAKNSGIDPEKYCFDKANVDLLIKAEESENSSSSGLKKEPVNSQSTRPQPRQQEQAQEDEVYHRPAGTPTNYRPMSDAEILVAQLKLAESEPKNQKQKVK